MMMRMRMESVLPDEIIIEEIMSRLPVKCLLRLRCVCKGWRDLISNPNFISLHLKRSGSIGNKLIGYCLRSHKIYTLDVEKPDEVVELGYETSSISEKLRMCLGCCDGLMCLLHTGSTTVSLFNPSTRKHMTIKQPLSFRSYQRAAVATGFFFDPISFDYKLLRIYNEMRDDSSKVMVYSFDGGDAWNTLGVIPYKYFFPTVGTLVCGALHWVTSRERTLQAPRNYLDKLNHVERSILAINPVTMEIVEVPQPEIEEDLQSHEVKAFVVELGGCLALVRKYIPETQVWIMKQYGVRDSWVKCFVFGPLPPIPESTIEPLCIRPNGDLLWISKSRWGLQQQHQEVQHTNSLEDSKWQNKYQRTNFVPHVESLVSFQIGPDGKQHIVGRKPTLLND